MNKIFNWTFGSIFRTLGRIICYLVVGALLGLFLSKNNVKITDLLGIQHVYASTISTTDKKWRIRTCYNSSSADCTWVSGTMNMGTNYSLPSGHNDKGIIDGYIARFTFNDNFQAGLTYRASINVTSSAGKFNKAQLREVICGGVADPNNWSSNNDLVSQCVASGIVSYDSGNKTSYYIDFTPLTSFKGVQLQFYFFQPVSNMLGGTTTVLSSSNIQVDTSTQDAINNQTTTIINQTNEINNSVNNINDSINDDNVNEANTTASNFFSNFSTNDHGLSGIITAPLNAIQGLLNKRCTPLSLPIPFIDSGDTIDLPCMRDIYVGWFGDFMTFYDVIVDGVVAYWILVRLFSMVKDFKNPNHDEIEVMEL